MSYDWVIVAYPTVMDGLVLRWYASTDAATDDCEHLSASRNGVVVCRPGELAESARPEADEAHRLLAASYDHNYERVKAMATHRKDLFGHELTPVADINEGTNT